MGVKKLVALLGIKTDKKLAKVAAALSGASLGDLETSIKRLQSSQVEAADGVATYADKYARMGIEVKDADGNFKETPALLAEVADGMQGLDTAAEKTAVAMKLLGRGGANLIPMLNQGGAAILDMMQEMHDLGGVIDVERDRDAL